MLYSSQIRAARALLAWRQGDLAKAAKVGVATINRIEQQTAVAMGNVATIMRLQQALEKAGIKFLDTDTNGGPGVRWKSAPRSS